MLTELSIKNFAIIDQLSVSLQKGLTVLTGETGAGKSIIIDALGLLIGGRGSVEYVRHGEKKAELEGLFIIDDEQHPIIERASSLGIEISDDQMIVLHRTISHTGKSICRINGKLTTLGILKEIGQSLLDIHSQHETQSLLNTDKHIELLDYFHQTHEPNFRNEYDQLYQKWKELKKKYDEKSRSEQEIAQRLDLLEFQLNEIQSADLEPNEDQSLMEERNQLVHYEQIYQNVSDAYQALHGEHQGLDWLQVAGNHLESAGEHSDHISKMHETFTDHYFMIEELSYDIRNFLDQIEFDPNRLQIIEERLNEINQLKKKYGNSVEDIMEYSAKVEEELEEIRNYDQHLENLSESLTELSEDLLLEAKHLRDVRKQVATQLEQAVLTELSDLYLDQSTFKVDVALKTNDQGELEMDGTPVTPNENGVDQVKFFISTNPGEPAKPLHRTASGGEMSRIMLALKNIFSQHQGVSSVIFDEVDTGVSGRVAQAMAEKILNISIGSQVICITHLPQVASMADSHLQIEKQVEDERTKTYVRELNTEERIAEIGRMMTGTSLTDTSKEHAKELIQLSNQLKK
ncbi:DNA repair protein RecN [Gracilibacillus halophilus YIM-C55.5]|uniref:DNA repair protein RecN n=1 Tax=Gracilibacillus halophilus YIM-C55.5 TaxID=1308866 RepID=N4WMM8_9BACI|nr:DNA repair protein RecN [Gracilibacillus halophilus]ENH97422.1 DNA repair protein RecN [Gracilibacillus halophilus YIM-C55.5]